MESIKERLSNPVISIVLGVIIGLLLGLIWAYAVAPIDWQDAAPVHLRADLQADYMRMTIDSFARTGDVQAAQTRVLELGAAAGPALEAVMAEPRQLTIVEVDFFRSNVIAPLGSLPEQPAGEGEEEGGTNYFLWFLCIAVLVIGAVLLAVYLFRRGPEGETSSAMQAAEVTRSTERTDYVSMGEEAPISQYMTTFMLGDDLFDDSFSIDSPAGEFLGECGVGIAESTGTGEPKSVSAFEVWLFDKNDIQTVTKVVMSESAYHDVATHDRLSAKGDPVLAEVDRPIVLETAKLRLSARIVDMSYGDDPMLPENSYFNQMTLELAIWPR